MWTLAEVTLRSRMLLGTARYASVEMLRQAIARSQVEVVTVSLRRETARGDQSQRFWSLLRETGARVLPNTAGCRTAKEAVLMAELGRELFATRWVKLEVVAEESRLQPDPFETLSAARTLVQQGFEVFPYVTCDLALGDRLIDAGCRVLMPWGAPIGSGRGLVDADALRAYRRRFAGVTLIVDAGLGRPSHAAQAMELGFDAVLLNTAVALSGDAPKMAEAFARAVDAGRAAYEAGMMPERDEAVASTPEIGAPFA